MKLTWLNLIFKYYIYISNIEQCCDTIELSSTTNAGHPGLGTYTKKPYDNDGRAVYYNGWGYVYWRSDVNMWSVSIKRLQSRLYFCI